MQLEDALQRPPLNTHDPGAAAAAAAAAAADCCCWLTLCHVVIGTTFLIELTFQSWPSG